MKASFFKKLSNVDGFEVELELTRDDLIRLLVGETVVSDDTEHVVEARCIDTGGVVGG